MSQHPNARLTPKEQKTLVSRIGSGAGVVDGQLHELHLGVLGQELVEHVRRRTERDAETLDEAPLPSLCRWSCWGYLAVNAASTLPDPTADESPDTSAIFPMRV